MRRFVILMLLLVPALAMGTAAAPAPAPNAPAAPAPAEPGKADYDRAYELFMAKMEGLRVEDFADVDLREVERLSRRAADQGHGGAMNLLYMIYGNGYGREEDIVEAMTWLQRAAEAGDVGARINLATMLYEGREWLPRDRDRACRMFVEFADIDGAGAFSLYYLGLATLRGECGLDEDEAKGIDFIRRAADGGVRDAERDYARALLGGTGVTADSGKAIEWFQRAADHGDAYSLWQLGMAHVNGDGRELDPVRAVEYFRSAVEAGSSDALISLAVMYATGSGVELDSGKAIEFYKRAADVGEAHAYRSLAGMAINGEGMASDPVQAWVYYSQSLELGGEAYPALAALIEGELDAAERTEAEARLLAWRAERAAAATPVK